MAPFDFSSICDESLGHKCEKQLASVAVGVSSSVHYRNLIFSQSLLKETFWILSVDLDLVMASRSFNNCIGNVSVSIDSVFLSNLSPGQAKFLIFTFWLFVILFDIMGEGFESKKRKL